MEDKILWARVGISFKGLNEEELALRPAQTLMKAFKEGRAFLDGETYFPEDEYENSLVDSEVSTYFPGSMRVVLSER